MQWVTAGGCCEGQGTVLYSCADSAPHFLSNERLASFAKQNRLTYSQLFMRLVHLGFHVLLVQFLNINACMDAWTDVNSPFCVHRNNAVSAVLLRICCTGYSLLSYPTLLSLLHPLNRFSYC